MCDAGDEELRVHTQVSGRRRARRLWYFVVNAPPPRSQAAFESPRPGLEGVALAQAHLRALLLLHDEGGACAPAAGGLVPLFI
jgi:hypothetical protein